jgi:hypothetical protein
LEFIVDPSLLSYEKNSLLEKSKVKVDLQQQPATQPEPTTEAQAAPVSRTAIPATATDITNQP